MCCMCVLACIVTSADISHLANPATFAGPKCGWNREVPLIHVYAHVCTCICMYMYVHLHDVHVCIYIHVLYMYMMYMYLLQSV